MPHDPNETSNRIVVQQLHTRLRLLERAWAADCLAFISPITYGADDAIRDAIEHLTRRGGRNAAGKRPHLAFLLETEGGYIEVAERIADTCRRHYERVEFIVPNYALSAGTVLVMSGDAIWMDYYSIVGPIDPQIQRQGQERFVPALGYLVQYQRLIEKSESGDLTTAELAFLLDKFDPAELYAFEQAKNLSITLLKKWLAEYKFKNWMETEARHVPVTPEMRVARAEEIANQLNATEQWHSHSRGISMEVLRRDLKLQVEDFGADNGRDEAVRRYYRLLKDYMARVGMPGIVHAYKSFRPLEMA